MISALKKLFHPDSSAHIRYAAIVARARTPILYTNCAIPDTLDGRFEAILLHLFLHQRPLKAASQDALILALNEAFIADMDRSLRELGVGDTGVGKRIKAMGYALLGRLTAYEEAFADDVRLREALKRNVYGTVNVTDEAVNCLISYIRSYNTTN